MKNYIDFFKQKFLKTHKSDKRILAWISVLLVCFVIFWTSYYSWVFKTLFSDVFVWFEVSWANFDLDIKKINILTNNPAKIEFLENIKDLKIAKRIPAIIEPNCYNKDYLRTKKEQMGHMLWV